MKLTLLLAIASAFGVGPVPPGAMKKMDGVSWHSGCPVALGDLRQLTVAYYDFHSRKAQGVLYVHKDVAAELKGIFEDLLKAKFQIERISPVEEYGGNDDRSMAANNTSAFNCRDITGTVGRFSNHSW